jgi:hypothetical protein
MNLNCVWIEYYAANKMTKWHVSSMAFDTSQPDWRSFLTPQEYLLRKEFMGQIKTLLTVLHSTVYRYSETNVMHFLFNLLRSKGLYMFRALLAHPQELIHKRHLAYYVQSSNPGAAN